MKPISAPLLPFTSYSGNLMFFFIILFKFLFKTKLYFDIHCVPLKEQCVVFSGI